MPGTATLEWVGYNLMLAVMPALGGYLIAAGIDRYTLRKRTVPWTLWILPLLAWLAFLPNTCYLLSEWRHFLFDDKFTDIRYSSANDPNVMLEVARQGLFFLGYSAAGALLFALAIRPLHRVLRKAKFNLVLCAIPFFLLVSLGVYLGLIVRLNSWDIVIHPAYVIHVVIRAATIPRLLDAIVVFAVLLWLLYIIIDMWVDGFMMRMNGAHHAHK